MAKDKKGFILYADQKELFDQLPNEKAGELIKHIFSYVNDENPINKDLIINLAFTPIKQQLKRDLQKFEDVKVKRSEAGKKSAEAREIKRQQALTNSTSVKSVQQTLTNPTVRDNVTVTVNDTVKVKDNNNNPSNDDGFNSFWNTYDKKMDKKKCETKWNNLKKSDKETILKTVKNYVSVNSDSKYRKNPLTYLNGECWNDEVKENINKDSDSPFSKMAF